MKLEYEEIVRVYKQYYDVYGFAEDFFSIMKDQRDPKQLIETFISKNDKKVQGLTLVFLIYYYYMDEINNGLSYTKLMERLEKLDRYFFMECYFSNPTLFKK